MAQHTTYSVKFTGRTTAGNSYSKTIGDLNGTTIKTITEANTMADKLVKIYDSGTTMTAVTRITNDKFDTDATA